MPAKKDRSLLDLLSQLEVEGHREEAKERDLTTKPSRLPAPIHIPVMRLESLKIENLWCYEHAEISFDEGITVIAGPNGSGKSSLLESIFFALYGSKAGPAMDRPLSDVLRLGARSGSVQLKFRYGSKSYTAQMALRLRGDTVVSEREDCRLTREDGVEWVGVENISQAIEELFGMNRDDFTNCVYVRQGEIDRLIRAGEEERRRMIDRLLRLERLDRYAQRAHEGARRAVNRRLEVLRHLAQDFKLQIETLEAEKPERLLGEIERKIRTKQVELKDLEEKISQAEKVQYSLREKLQRLEELAQEIEERISESSKKERQIKQHEAKEQRLRAELEALKQRYKHLEGQLAKGLSQLKLARDPVIRSLSLASSWEEVEILPQELIQTKSQQERLYAQIQERQMQIALEIERSSAEREALLKDIVQAKAQEQHIEQELQEMQALIRQGRCPVCKQPISQETFNQEIEEKGSALKGLNSKIQSQQEKIKELESRTELLKREGEEVIQKLNEDFRALEVRRTQLEELKEQTLRLLQIKDQGQEKKSSWQEVMEAQEALKDELARLKAKIAQLKTKLADSKELQEKSQKVQEALSKLLAQKEGLQKEIETLLHERGVLDSRIEQLKRYKQAQAETEKELKDIERLQAELEQLQAFYEALKRELRQRNVKAIELYFNQLFRLMDSGASYRGVRVTEDYEIFVELKDGSTIRPELLSGGERALINIALRSAIHQVLSQATSRMPLILDEPTIYLDRERVNRLQFLLEELGNRVGQVIVVSHELGLLEGADHEYRTEKLADNTSRVYRVR